MKIILVTPLLDHGGGQRYVTVLANYWASIDYDVEIILLRKGEPFYPISDAVTVHKLNYSSNNFRIKFFTGFRTFFRLRRIIKKANPIFVISILSTTNILTLASTLFLGTKVFVRDAMSPFRKRSKFERILRKILYKKATGVITMTEIAKNFIKKETGVENIRVIPNPVKDITFHDSDKLNIVLNVGRLMSAKGQNFFLEACAKINRPDWKFIILGDGYLRESLEDQIFNLGIQDKVIMPGSIKNVDEWYLKSSIFVFPSISEGFPNALLEAMSVGLPCVSFDCKVGPADIIDDEKNGFLVPEGDIDTLVERIERLMDDEDLRNKFSLNAKESSKNFKIEKISEKILDFCIN